MIFCFRFFFFNPTDRPTSGNAFDAKRKKKGGGDGLIKIDFSQSQETASNRKSAKSVITMVLKSLEIFMNRFNFPTLMGRKVKLLEILLRSSHTKFWLSKT